MGVLYRLSIRLYGLVIRLAALRSEKARRWLQGRKNWPETLRQKRAQLPAAPLWVHVSSLGELEQALPVLRLLRERHPSLPFLITFFSPSGYENYRSTDPLIATALLPLDTPTNAQEFIEIVAPRASWFVKYDVWPCFLRELSRRGIPALLAPALFRPGQVYFWPLAGSYFRRALGRFSQVLTQDLASAQRIRPQIASPVAVAGDPRFDRGEELLSQDYTPLFPVKDWQQEEDFTLIAGSSWPPEERILPRALAAFPRLRLILAPHDLSDGHLKKITENFQEYGLSRWSTGKPQPHSRVLLVDTIGELKFLYRYGQAALVGGGFGKSVHSTIEPMAYGLPMAFGPEHGKFLEPGRLIQAGGAREIREAKDLLSWLEPLVQKGEEYQKQATATQGFFARNTGASQAIQKELAALLKGKKAH